MRACSILQPHKQPAQIYRLIRTIKHQTAEFDWLTNIIGQDYPIQPLAEMAAFLAQTEYDGVMEYFKVFSKESHWIIREGQTRYLVCYNLVYYNLVYYKKYIESFPEWQKRILNLTNGINCVQLWLQTNFA